MFTQTINRLVMSALIVVTSVLTACVGGGDVPVLYTLPADSSTVYDVTTFKPRVDFPNGSVPAGLEIRINGVIVTADFDDIGSDYVTITGTVNDGSHDTMLGALREGDNTFQSTSPVGLLAYFIMDMAEADMRITEVIDNFCGTVYITTVGSAADAGDGQITDFDCTNYKFQSCHTPWTAGDYGLNDNHDGNGTIKWTNPPNNTTYAGDSIPKAYCDIYKTMGSTTVQTTDYADLGGSHITSTTRPVTSYKYIRGRIENESAATSLYFERASISTNNVRTSAGSVVVNQDNEWVSSPPMYIHFGQTNASCNGTTVDLDVNEFCAIIPDADSFRIGLDAGEYREWTSSDIGMKDSRLGIGGTLGIKIAESSILSFLGAGTSALATGQNLVSGNTNLSNECPVGLQDWDCKSGPNPKWGGAPRDTCVPGDALPSGCVSQGSTCQFDKGCSSFSVDSNTIILNKMDVDASLPNVPGRLDLDVDMNDTSGNYGIDINLQIGISCADSGLFSGGNSFTCWVIDALGGVLNDIDVGLDLSTVAEASLSVNSYIVDTTVTMNGTTIQNLFVDSGNGFLDGIINSFMGDLIINIIMPIIEGMIAGMIGPIVDGIFNADLPLTRLVLPSVDNQGQARPVYLALGLEVNELTTAMQADGDMALVLGLGAHTSGKPRLNDSLGTNYKSGTGIGMMTTVLARDDIAGNYGTLGIALHEAFINQLFMGLWESGILYIDFNAGNDPTVNTFMDNANIKFASVAPWLVDHLEDGVDDDAAKGDLKIQVEDLVIHFSGDIYDPFQGKWFLDRVVFELAIDLEAYVNLTSNNQAISFEFSSNPVVEMTTFYSDYIPGLNESLGQSLLNVALPNLVTNLSAIELALPQILGLDMNIKEAWVEDTENLGLTLDVIYNP